MNIYRVNIKVQLHHEDYVCYDKNNLQNTQVYNLE
jgi:hypothetical protein